MPKMMKKNQFLAVALAVVLMVGMTVSLYALQTYLQAFNVQYPSATGTKLDSCTLCHPGGNTAQFNPYATAFAAAGHNFIAIEQLDSDGDGLTNIQEITAGTFPGDPNDPPPNVSCIPTEGTIGTEMACTGAGFGSKKGKVLIGDLKQKVDSWNDGAIAVTVKKVPLPIGPYSVTIDPKDTTSIILTDAFTVTKPEIDEATVGHGAPGAEATVGGLWFGSKKGNVFVGQQKCKVKSWTMDPVTGVSTVVFVVHKKIGAGNYLLEVENKIGRSVALTLFGVP